MSDIDEVVQRCRKAESKLEFARAELESAALALGEKFANEIDATWDECQRFERAALEFYKASKS